MMSKPLVLIPAAGFGTRVGSPPAKELLPGPSGSPLIAFGLEQARLRGWPVHVITRAEKTELIAYLEAYRQQWGLELAIQIIDPSREWPDTLLQSEPSWHEKNLLCLPDTVFEPLGVWDRLAGSSADIAAAVFDPPDFSVWGVFRQDSSGLSVCEKPSSSSVADGDRAWGVLCWRRESGLALLRAQLESGRDHQWKKIAASLEFFPLSSFDDVTRSPSSKT